MAMPGGSTGPYGARTRRASSWAVAAAVAAIVAGIWIIWAFWGDRTIERGEDVAGLVNVTVAEIAENLDTYEGKTVAVQGEVAGTLAPASFLLEDDDALVSEQILVVNATGSPISVAEDEPMRVIGEVESFDQGRLERGLGYDLDDALYAPWEGKPVVMASTIEKADDEEPSAPQDPVTAPAAR